jgi:hypothetical protein
MEICEVKALQKLWELAMLVPLNPLLKFHVDHRLHVHALPLPNPPKCGWGAIRMEVKPCEVSLLSKQACVD